MRPTVMGRRELRPGTARIEKECAVLCLNLRLVRMTIDHRVDVVGGLEVKLGQSVYHVNAEAIDLDPLRHRYVRAPGAVIDVSAHGVDRRQRAEPRKYVRAANIPGMDDRIAAGKCR